MWFLKNRSKRKNRDVSKITSDISKELDTKSEMAYISSANNSSYNHVTDKPKSEAAINAIYTKVELAHPLIIWTQSPMGNVFAKASIDYFSEKDLKFPWGFWRHNPCEHNNDIRAGAWQSISEAGWKIGDAGTGAEAWHDITLYQYRSDINWRHIALSNIQDGPRVFENMNQSNSWLVIGDTVAARSNDDWLVDMWARFRFQRKHPNPNVYRGGGRSMHVQLQRDKFKFRHQNNLNSLPEEVPDIKDTRFAYPTNLHPNFQTLRDTAGWIMPYENICFVSERASHVNIDSQNRMHCETGTATTYPDGFSIYAWHGTLFPEEWLRTKPTPCEALNWRNIEQ